MGGCMYDHRQVWTSDSCSTKKNRRATVREHTTAGACPVCEWPEGALDFSLVVEGTARVGSHSHYKGLAIGKLLVDASPNEDATIDRTKSYVKRFARSRGKPRWNFNGGLFKGADLPFSWAAFERFAECLGRQAQWLSTGPGLQRIRHSQGYQIIVLDQGASARTYSMDKEIGLSPGSQGEDNGKTLVVFTGTGTVTLTKNRYGRQFGPT